MKKSMRRNIIEWAIILFVGGFLYYTGLYVEVGGKVQQLLLWTGLRQPDNILEPAERQPVSGNWRLVNNDGEALFLNDLRGKVLFINFWASWCPPCVAEMPNIHDLYIENKNTDIQFLMVSLDETPQKAMDFMKRKEFQFPIFFPGSRIPKALYSESIPTTFVLDKMGRIAIEETGFADYNNTAFKKSLELLATE